MQKLSVLFGEILRFVANESFCFRFLAICCAKAETFKTLSTVEGLING